MTYKDVVSDIIGTSYKECYTFLDYENTSNMGAPGISLMIDGGGYITLISNGKNISKIVVQKERLASGQNIKNPKGYPKSIIFNILSSVL